MWRDRYGTQWHRSRCGRSRSGAGRGSGCSVRGARGGWSAHAADRLPAASVIVGALLVSSDADVVDLGECGGGLGGGRLRR